MLGRGLARRWLLALVPTGVMLSLKGARAAVPLSPAALIVDALGAPDSLAAIGGAAIGGAAIGGAAIGRAAATGGGAGLPRTADEVAAAIMKRHAAVGANLYDRPALRRALAEAVRADFGREDVVVVDGWVLARIEAELAILAARQARVA
jgi:hypothetical protein